MKKYILCITLNPVCDLTVVVKKTRQGDFKAIKEEFSAGGKGINVSRALKSLGASILNIGLVGGTRGALIEKLLTREKLSHQLTKIKANARVHTTFINVKDILRVFGDEPRAVLAEQESFLKCFKKSLNGASAVILSGAILKGFKNSIYRELITLTNKKNIPCVCDTRDLPLKQALLVKPFLVKPNLDELKFLFPQKEYSLEDLKMCLMKIHQRGAQNVIISLEEKGAVGYNGEDMFWVKPKRIKLASYVGCGDALVAGFISAFLKKKIFKDALTDAVATATASGLNAIPGGVDKRKIRSILETLKIYDLNNYLNNGRQYHDYFRP